MKQKHNSHWWQHWSPLTFLSTLMWCLCDLFIDSSEWGRWPPGATCVASKPHRQDRIQFHNAQSSHSRKTGYGSCSRQPKAWSKRAASPPMLSHVPLIALGYAGNRPPLQGLRTKSDLVNHLTMNVETLVCFSCTDNKWLLLNQKSPKRMLRWTYQPLRLEIPKIPKLSV